MGDQYIVLANDNRVQGNEIENIQPPNGMSCYPVRRARIYALDLKGKLAWPAPVDVDHQQFLLSQPGRLPVLLFAALHYPTRAGQTMRTSLVAIDRRNGNIVYDKDGHSPIRWMGGEIHGDPADKSVRVTINSEIVKLTFTDKPIQTVVRHTKGVQKPRGKLGEALTDAVEGAAVRRIKEDRLMNKLVACRVWSTAPYLCAAVLAAIVLMLPARAWSAEKVGDRDIDRTISRGLDWLASRQSRLGHWTAPEGTLSHRHDRAGRPRPCCARARRPRRASTRPISSKAVDYLVSRSRHATA